MQQKRKQYNYCTSGAYVGPYMNTHSLVNAHPNMGSHPIRSLGTPNVKKFEEIVNTRLK